MGYFPQQDYQAVARQLLPEMNHRQFLQIAVPLEQALSEYLCDNDFLVKKLDGHKKDTLIMPVTLVLDNLRSAFNTGSIIRSAECFGIQHLCFCGYTPDNSRVAQTAMGTREFVNIDHYDSTQDAVFVLKKSQYNIYALETSSNSTTIYNSKIDFPAALIVGNEALGISPDILKLADCVLEIPLAGWKNSLNVASAASIALSEFYRRFIQI
jgi:tRNA G18 (ribose-2'-O)-methylase SpoU